MGVEEQSGLFDNGLDRDHEGLWPPQVVPEQDPKPSRNGRNIQREDAFAQMFEEVNALFDGNIGDSRPSSDEEEQ